MKALTVNARDKKQFESSLHLMQDFSKGRNELEWEGENISFIFLKNPEAELDEILLKGKTKKTTR